MTLTLGFNSSPVLFQSHASNRVSIPENIELDNSHTLLIIKPDIPAQNRVGEVIKFLENLDFEPIAIKFKQLTINDIDALYPDLRTESVRYDVLDLMTSGPVVIIVLKANLAAERLAALKGRTNPSEAAVGTLRAAFGTTVKWNAVHCSDDSSAAKREVALFFTPGELEQGLTSRVPQDAQRNMVM